MDRMSEKVEACPSCGNSAGADDGMDHNEWCCRPCGIVWLWRPSTCPGCAKQFDQLHVRHALSGPVPTSLRCAACTLTSWQASDIGQPRQMQAVWGESPIREVIAALRHTALDAAKRVDVTAGDVRTKLGVPDPIVWRKCAEPGCGRETSRSSTSDGWRCMNHARAIGDEFFGNPRVPATASWMTALPVALGNVTVGEVRTCNTCDGLCWFDAITQEIRCNGCQTIRIPIGRSAAPAPAPVVNIVNVFDRDALAASVSSDDFVAAVGWACANWPRPHNFAGYGPSTAGDEVTVRYAGSDRPCAPDCAKCAREATPKVIDPLDAIIDGVAQAFVADCDRIRAAWPIAVSDVDALVERFYAMPENGVGGSLHIVLDDCNINDGSVEWCIEHARGRDDRAGEALGRLLLAMPWQRRADLHAICSCCVNRRTEEHEPGEVQR